MSTAVTFNAKALTLVGIDANETLEQMAEAIKSDLVETLRRALRTAVRIAVAKRAHFAGEFGPWCDWVTTTFGVQKRTAITYCNAGECLLAYAVRHVALTRCDLARLEIIAALDSRQMDLLFANHAEPGMIERDELREIVARIKGKTVRPRQLSLPGLDELGTYDAQTLDPVREASYMGGFFKRATAALEVKSSELTDAQRTKFRETVLEIEGELAVWRNLLAEA